MGVLENPARCCFCGHRKAVAYWDGFGKGVSVSFRKMRPDHFTENNPDPRIRVVTVCEACALDALPALIADAMVGNGIDRGGWALSEITKRFWRAAYDALHRYQSDKLRKKDLA